MAANPADILGVTRPSWETEDVSMLKDMATKWLEAEIAPHYEDFEKNEIVGREHWLKAGEEETADLLVPMLTLSGLFEDEDFQNVRNSEKLSRQMADAIPDSLTDLYLLFHAPD